MACTGHCDVMVDPTTWTGVSNFPHAQRAEPTRSSKRHVSPPVGARRMHHGDPRIPPTEHLRLCIHEL